MKRTLFALLALVTTSAWLGGCGDDGDDVVDGAVVMRDSGMTPDSGRVPDSGVVTPDSGMMMPDTGMMMPDTGMMMPDSGTGPLDFLVFTKGLVDTQTSDTTAPTTIDDKTFVDREDSAFFNSYFP